MIGETIEFIIGINRIEHMSQLNCSDNALKPQNMNEMEIYMDGYKSSENEVVLNRLQMKNNVAENIEYYR
jgi:hypothetical protein